MDDDWSPDNDFLAFLETIPLNRVAKEIGELYLREMRAGTKTGREIYENTVRDLWPRYELHRNHKYGMN